MDNKFYFLKNEFEDSEPYEGDVLNNRKEFANNLKKIIGNIGDGAVISIDAPWGEGKTTFIKWFQDDLKKNEYLSTNLDAFEHDFQGDAFSAIFPALMQLFRSNKSEWENFKSDTCSNITKKFETIVKKGAPILAGGLATASTSNPIIGETVGKLTETITDAILSDDKPVSAHQQLRDLKEELKKFTSTVYGENGGKPFIFIIDELDRCRPNFAVEMLEKIKHFFSVPGIIWILAINKEQLADSIKHVYGNKEPHLYFEKFINIQTVLPKGLDNYNYGDGKQLVHSHYVKYFLNCTNISDLKIQNTNVLQEYIGIIYAYYNFSLRDIKKHSFYISLLTQYNLNDPLLYILPTLYIKKPSIYYQIRTNQFEPKQLLESFDWVFQYCEFNEFTSYLCGAIYCVSLRTNQERGRIVEKLLEDNNTKLNKWEIETKKYLEYFKSYTGRLRIDKNGDFLHTNKYINIINSFSSNANYE